MKKLLVGVLLGGLCIGLSMYIQSSTHNAMAVSTQQYTCKPNGTFISPSSGPAALTSEDFEASSQALAWLKKQQLTTSLVTTSSTITPSQTYISTHTGPVSGTFALEGITYPVKSDAPLEISSPTSISSTYSGVVQGRVLTPPTQWRWIIQVYKKTDSGYVQVPKQALADGVTGEFSVDLSDISNPPSGEWAFGILDAENSYTPYGSQWPSENYFDGLEVQQKLVTDAVYDWSTTRAYADGTFSFNSSNTGKKLLRLVDTQSQAIIAEYVDYTGLLRSYEFDTTDPEHNSGFANQSFVYDQALAVFTALGVNDQSFATSTINGLLEMQETNGQRAGAFVFAAPYLTPTYRTALIRTGAHALATDALLAYIQKYPQAPNIQLVTERAEQALAFIHSVRSTTGSTEGLYLGGYGDYNGPQNSFRPDERITWASTEHNIDIWHVFMRAAKALPVQASTYNTKAHQLHEALQLRMYNTSEQRYNQGMTPSGPDTANPLDVNSWGAIQLYGAGEHNKAAAALEQLPLFKFTRSGITGYAPFYDSPGYPGAVENVWYEGSFGVALAYLRTGEYDAYRILMNTLREGQDANGAFVYATDIDNTYEITHRKSVASTAWYILASTGRDVLWNNCLYVAPPTDATTPMQPAPQTPPQTSRQNTQYAYLGKSDISQDTPAITAALEAEQQTPPPQSAQQFSQDRNESGVAPSNTDKHLQKTNWWAIGGIVTVTIALLAGAVATLLKRHGR